MWSLQECTSKLHEYLREHKENRCLDSGMYHPDLMAFPELEQIRETTDKLSLAELWARSGALTTSGLQGSNYLLANKVYDTLISSAAAVDVCQLIGPLVSGWNGADLVVPIVADGMFKPQLFSSGGKAPEQEPTFVYAQLTPKLYSLNMNIGEDLIEDNALGLVEYLVKVAGQSCGKQASEMALTELIAAPDGDGTLNTFALSADETIFKAGAATDLIRAITELGQDNFIANTMIITPEAWRHSVSASASSVGWVPTTSLAEPTVPIKRNEYQIKMGMLDTLFMTSSQLHDAADVAGAAFTACKTIVFDRDNALLTGRKRWLQLDNFSDPKQDLHHAIVSFRQDSVSLYKDSICVATEA